VKGGTYSGQTITGNRASSNRIVMECEEGATCSFEGQLQIGDGNLSGCPGACAFSGPDYLTLIDMETSTFAEATSPGHYQHDNNRFGSFVLGGSTNIRLENIRQGGFLIQGAKDILFLGGDSGPCMAPSLTEFEPPGTVDHTNPCELNKMDFACDVTSPGQSVALCQTERITIDGLTVFNYAYTAECIEQGESGPDGCHHRNWYMNGVKDVTIRNSTFKESVFEPWATISGSDAGATGNEGILWENNQFGASVFYEIGDYATEGHNALGGGATCWSSSQPSYRNIIIRFNSFARYGGLAVPGNIPSADDDSNDQSCTVSGYKVYGNIFGTKPSGDNGCGNSGHAIQYRYNVYAGSVGGTCSGTGETNIGGTTMSFYTDPDWAPEAGDYELTGAAMAADNLVPADDASFPCPSTDASGTARPSGAGQFCDAGAYER
jgi:hypothetical protein